MKIIEIAKKAKDFVIEKIRKQKYKMSAQNGQEEEKQEQAKKYSREDKERQETAETDVTEEEINDTYNQVIRNHKKEKEKMSNNKRRMRGIPMVRRPKRQKHRARKKKE